MVKEIGPAKLQYATDKPEESAVAMPAEEAIAFDRELKPAALKYAAEQAKEGTVALAKKPLALYKELQPATLRYAAEEKIIPVEIRDKDTSKGKAGTKTATQTPEASYRIPRQRRTRKGQDLMGKKKVVLKVEDLQRAGRSHFEIPKSKQKAAAIKPSQRRG